MRNKIIGLVVLCVIVCLTGAASVTHADQILTGGNISPEARAKIEQMKPNSTFEIQSLPPVPTHQEGF